MKYVPRKVLWSSKDLDERDAVACCEVVALTNASLALDSPLGLLVAVTVRVEIRGTAMQLSCEDAYVDLIDDRASGAISDSVPKRFRPRNGELLLLYGMAHANPSPMGGW